MRLPISPAPLGGVLLAFVCASIASGQAARIEDRLTSKDAVVARAAVTEVMAVADRAEPLWLMLAASRQFEMGATDEAVFWFYAGQLRARYASPATGDGTQLVTIYTMSFGEGINAHGMRDVVKMIETIARAMQWDEKTYDAWATANRLDPSNAELLQRRMAARDGLVAFATDLRANRQRYEKHGREYKSPEQVHREAEASVKRDYTTAPLDRVVGGRTLRIPANYLTTHGLTARPNQTTNELTAIVFLPAFVGYTLENWRDLGDNKNVMWVRLKTDAGPKPEDLIEAFIATGPPTARVGSLDAYHFDARATKARLPLPGASTHHIVAGTGSHGNPAYLICPAPEGATVKPLPRCEMFTSDASIGLRLHAQFFQTHAPQWQRIEARLNDLVKSWTVSP
jgi:hypothetical protein